MLLCDKDKLTTLTTTHGKVHEQTSHSLLNVRLSHVRLNLSVHGVRHVHVLVAGPVARHIAQCARTRTRSVHVAVGVVRMRAAVAAVAWLDVGGARGGPDAPARAVPPQHVHAHGRVRGARDCAAPSHHGTSASASASATADAAAAAMAAADVTNTAGEAGVVIVVVVVAAVGIVAVVVVVVVLAAPASRPVTLDSARAGGDGGGHRRSRGRRRRLRSLGLSNLARARSVPRRAGVVRGRAPRIGTLLSLASPA